MLLNSRDRKLLASLNLKAQALGFSGFEDYFSARLSWTLQKMACELTVAYARYSTFCHKYSALRQVQECSAPEFQTLFAKKGVDNERACGQS